MQLKFEELPYQQKAIESVISLFKDEPNKTTEFSLNAVSGMPVVANQLVLSIDEIARNLNSVQKNSIRLKRKLINMV